MAFILSMAVFVVFLLTQPHVLAAATKMENTPPPPASSSSSTSSSSSSKWASIHGRLRLPDPAQSLNSTRITLNDGTTHSTYTLPDGSFVFRRVPPGVHLLDVQSRVHHFSQVKVQILPGSMDSPRCVEYVYPGATKQAVPHPLELTAHASYEYYEPRQGFSLMSILKNPMVLMMIMGVGGMYMMPKVMDGLDPEQKELMQKQMAMQQDPSKVSRCEEGGGGVARSDFPSIFCPVLIPVPMYLYSSFDSIIARGLMFLIMVEKSTRCSLKCSRT